MKRPEKTLYELFEAPAESRRSIRQEELILEVTERLVETLERERITRTELATRLGKTKGFVSQLLSGGRNLTLRSVADIAGAIGYKVTVRLEPVGVGYEFPAESARAAHVAEPGRASRVRSPVSRDWRIRS